MAAGGGAGNGECLSARQLEVLGSLAMQFRRLDGERAVLCDENRGLRGLACLPLA